MGQTAYMVAEDWTAIIRPDDWCRPLCIRQSGGTTDIIKIIFDPVSNLIKVHASGSWSIEETGQYLAALDRMVKGVRSRSGRARVLLDRRDVSCQSPPVMELLAKANGEIFAADDRVALVVTSSLIKSGLRQRMPHEGSKAFLSIDAAEKWLGAFGASARSPY